MADYLSNLIAKNLSPQESIHPRSRSRFEPPSLLSVDPGPAEMSAKGEPQPITPSSFDSASSFPLPDRIPSWTQPAQPAFGHAPASPFAEAITSAPEEPGQPNLPVDPSAFQPYRGRLDPPSPPVQAATQPETPPGQFMADNKNQPADSPRQTREIVLERIVERALAPTIEPSVRPPQPAAELPASEPSQPTPLASIAPAPEPAIQPLRPVVTPLPDLAARNIPLVPAPTVNVTIGRIEVRATPPITSPRRSTPQPNLMSLDDYLRSRANGDRR